MTSQRFKKVGRFSKVRRGASPRPIDDPKYFGGNVGWVRIADVSASRKYLKKTTQYVSELGEKNSVRVDKGDLIMSICGTIGKPLIIDIPACIHDGFVQLYDIKDSDTEFLYYSLQFSEEALKAQGQSGTQTNLNTSIVSELEIFHPSREEQTGIASVLSCIDRAIEQTEAIIAKQQRIKTGLMQDLLTNGIDKHGNIRSEATDEFKDSPLGRMPKEWNTKTIEEITSHVGSGVTPRGGSEVYESEGIVFIRSQNVYDDGLRLDDVAYINERTNSQMERSQVLNNDVLLNITGASIGRCCYVPVGSPRANVNQHVCIVRLKNDNVADAYFLATVLSSPIGQRQIKALNAGGNREGLNYQQIKSMIVPMPSDPEERAAIACKLKKQTAALKQYEAHMEKVIEVKQGLMQDLLTGKVTVESLLEESTHVLA